MRGEGGGDVFAGEQGVALHDEDVGDSGLGGVFQCGQQGGECAFMVGQGIGEVVCAFGVGIAVVCGGKPYGTVRQGVGDDAPDECLSVEMQQGFGGAHAAA